MIKIGIIGVGTVGQSVINILNDNKDIITARAGKEIVVTKGVVKNLEKKRDVDIILTDNIDDILNDDSINIVVELMGGVESAYNVVKKALEKGKSVVTANKALLAYHRYDLQDIAGDIPFEFEASVAGGIPIISSLREGLSANHINSIKGILNGTCNYMLTKMIDEGIDFNVILKEAQDLGYAEADPTFDIGGFDAGHKLLILASIAYGIDAKPEDILIEGIESINQIDIEFAKEFGYSIKLLAIAKKDGNEVSLRVHPVLIENSKMISNVNGVMNGISVMGDKVGETMYYGAGAGGDATASAVIADIVSIVRGGKTPMLGFKKPLETGLILASKDSIKSKYYLRINVQDKIGVLSKITNILSENNISIQTILQKSFNNDTNILLSTYICCEKDIQKSLQDISALETTKSKLSMIRIED